MGHLYDDWDGKTYASGYGSEDGPPTRRIKPPDPDGEPRKTRPPGTLHDTERVENAMFADDVSKT